MGRGLGRAATRPCHDKRRGNGQLTARTTCPPLSLYWTGSLFTSASTDARCRCLRGYPCLLIAAAPAITALALRVGRRSSSRCHFLLGKHRFCCFGYRSVFFWQRCLRRYNPTSGTVRSPVGEARALPRAHPRWPGTSSPAPAPSVVTITVHAGRPDEDL